MLTIEESRNMVEDYLKRIYGSRYATDIVIVDDQTIECPLGWMFSYQRRRRLETGRVIDGLIGNGPILVDKQLEKLVVFGSAGSHESCIKRYQDGQTRVDEHGVIHTLVR